MGSSTEDLKKALQDAIELYAIDGLDYLKEEQAAHYMGVCKSQFRARASELGIIGFWSLGKKLYKKQELKEALERQWRQSQRSTART